MTYRDIWTFGQQIFAKANGWRISRTSFSFLVLARGGVHSGWNWGDERGENILDHIEWYRKDRRAVAIVGHNYDGFGDDRDSGCYGIAGARRAAKKLGLILHVGSKEASWYYPGHATPLVLTRPDTDVVWPTARECKEIATMHAAEMKTLRAHRGG